MDGKKISSTEDCSVHTLCDASKYANAAAVFLELKMKMEQVYS